MLWFEREVVGASPDPRTSPSGRRSRPSSTARCTTGPSTCAWGSRANRCCSVPTWRSCAAQGGSLRRSRRAGPPDRGVGSAPVGLPVVRAGDEVAGRHGRARVRARGGGLMADLSTEVLVVGSGSGGSVHRRGAGRGGPGDHGARGGPASPIPTPTSRSRSPRWSQVPPPRGRRSHRQPLHRLRRGRCVRAAPRSTAEALPPAPRPPRRRVAGPLRHRRVRRAARRPTPTGSSPPRREHRAGGAPASSAALERGEPPSWGGATSSSPECSATTPRGGAAPSRRCRAPCCPGHSPPGRSWCPTAACSASSAAATG